PPLHFSDVSCLRHRASSIFLPTLPCRPAAGRGRCFALYILRHIKSSFRCCFDSYFGTVFRPATVTEEGRPRAREYLADVTDLQTFFSFGRYHSTTQLEGLFQVSVGVVRLDAFDAVSYPSLERRGVFCEARASAILK